MITDKLIDKIIEKQNVSVVGLDTALDYLPENMRKTARDFETAAEAVLEFNKRIIDATADLIPAVKIQIAYYEMYSQQGLGAFIKTAEYAKSKGLVVIADVKRNDIGATAGCYSKAYLGETDINGSGFAAFPTDYVTLNAYLGIDGIKPFADDMKTYGKGGFVLVKTSNKSSSQLQNLKLESGQYVYEYMGKLVSEWGADNIGGYGYSALGAVVGATHKEEAEKLRAQMKHSFFLVPGYGAQGGTADDLAVCFDARGLGAAVNSSRGILCAYKSEKYKGQGFDEAARNAVIDMKNDINGALKRRGVERIGG